MLGLRIKSRARLAALCLSGLALFMGVTLAATDSQAQDRVNNWPRFPTDAEIAAAQAAFGPSPTYRGTFSDYSEALKVRYPSISDPLGSAQVVFTLTNRSPTGRILYANALLSFTPERGFFFESAGGGFDTRAEQDASLSQDYVRGWLPMVTVAVSARLGYEFSPNAEEGAALRLTFRAEQASGYEIQEVCILSQFREKAPQAPSLFRITRRGALRCPDPSGSEGLIQPEPGPAPAWDDRVYVSRPASLGQGSEGVSFWGADSVSIDYDTANLEGLLPEESLPLEVQFVAMVQLRPVSGATTEPTRVRVPFTVAVRAHYALWLQQHGDPTSASDGRFLWGGAEPALRSPILAIGVQNIRMPCRARVAVTWLDGSAGYLMLPSCADQFYVDSAIGITNDFNEPDEDSMAQVARDVAQDRLMDRVQDAVLQLLTRRAGILGIAIDVASALVGTAGDRLLRLRLR